jgi:NADH-quinone oxidoreductase subunit N
MTGTDFQCLMPLIIIAGAPIIMMLTIAFTRHFSVIYSFSLLAFILAFLSVFFLPQVIPHRISSLLVFDGFTLLFFGIIIFASFLITILSRDFLLYQEGLKEEYFIVLSLAALGSMLLVAACNFVTLFLGLEILSVSLYVLVAYRRSRDHSIEAGVKYMILAAVSSAFLLFGMGLIYADTGSLEFDKIGQIIKQVETPQPLLLIGFSMMMVGLGFKLAAAPFHMWTPDVYQGAPAPVATFIATVSKGAVMALVLRFFYSIGGFSNEQFILMITIIAALSMFTGNILALRQKNIKRLLAYSSIANMGYLLVTLLIGNEGGYQAAVFYLLAYMITTLGAFGVIVLSSDKDNDADQVSDYKGLFWKRPWVALVFTLTLLSLAGIPVTAGFIGKFYIVFNGINSGLWFLVISLVINSVIGLYYYLSVITTLFSPAGEKQFPEISLAGHLVLGFVVIGILWLGINPGGIIELITRMAGIR